MMNTLKYFIPLLISLFILSCNKEKGNGILNQSNKLIQWNSQEGRKLFESTTCKNDFYELVPYFQPQINPLYCGIATSVVVLNTIRKPLDMVPNQPEIATLKPKQLGGGEIPFKSYSQYTFLNKSTDSVKLKSIINLENLIEKDSSISKIVDPGLTLNQLQKILNIYGLKTKLSYAESFNESNIRYFKNLLNETLQDNKQYIIANFLGKEIGNTTNGHISPIAAYNEAENMILILDVAGHKNSWYWVDIELFYKAMNTKDGDNYRGWIIVSE